MVSGAKKYFGTTENPKALTQALASGNRADAWYEIRYRSAKNGANGAGVVGRRFVDAQLFGLFDNPSAPSQSDVIQAYEMLTNNRSIIMAYEYNWDTDPDGNSQNTPNSGSAAANANLTYKLNGTVDQVQTLSQVFSPAQSLIINTLQFANPVLSWLTSEYVRSTDIFVASEKTLVINASTGDGGLSTADILEACNYSPIFA